MVLFLRKVIVVLFCLIVLCAIAFAQNQPNVVLFFVDDMGWADLNYRNEKFHTPNLNQLKSESLEFTRAYIPTPTCSPSRASLLTGKEAVRLQMVRHIADQGQNKVIMVDGESKGEYHLWEGDPAQMLSRNWLKLEEQTYAEALKKTGYHNYFIGKWHLGQEPFFPIHQGFDAQFHTNHHGHPMSYYSPFFKEGNPFPNKNGDAYLTDVLTDEAERFISSYDQTTPFMLSMWYFNVHGPIIGREDWVELYLAEGLSKIDAEYAAMVSVMDESIGRIRNALKLKGIEKNTVLIFISDQGGAFKNGQLRGGKKGGDALAEGGARVPMMIHYPGVTKPNTTSDIPVQTIDVFPTLMEIATGSKYKNRNIQGKSLMPIIKGVVNKKLAKRCLYGFRSYEDQYCSVVSGDWKIIKYRSGKFEMYNVKKDISEENNLIGTGLKEERRLKKQLLNWEQEAVKQTD